MKKKLHQEKANGYFFIINPTANNGRALTAWKQVRTFLNEEGIRYEFAFSRDAAHLEELAKCAADRKCIVVGVGGDGTISGIAGALKGRNASLGVIPAGTGNDFARTFSLPQNPVEACKVILSGSVEPIDLGCFNGRSFCNVVGAGLDAEVAADANSMFKRLYGSLGYVLALLRQLILYCPRPVVLTVDGKEYKEDVWLVSIANARYYGGGMMVAPNADPHDGLFDIVVVSNINRFKFLRLFPLVYRGKHVEHSSVKIWRGTQILVNSEMPLAVHADGEICGTTPLDVMVDAGAVCLIVPQNK